MTTINFKNFGQHLGTRVLGVEVRNQIIEMLLDSDFVIFDFEGVETVSNSFADECLAKLLYEFKLTELKRKTKFVNANKFISTVIANAFNSRISEIYQVQ